MRKVLYVLVVLLMFTGCDLNDLPQGGGIGKPVRFTVNSYYENGPKTRTSYSGEFYGDSPRFERIDWVDADLLRVWAQLADVSANGDFKVVSHETDSDNGRNSVAQVESYGDPLCWLNYGVHTFYALYPSPVTDGVNAGKVTLNKDVITATIPATQVVTAASGSKVFKPDMNYAYMWAATTADYREEVPLAFNPLMTTFEFTVASDGTTPFQLTSFVLSTDDASPFIAGDFTAKVSANLTSCPVTSVSNGSRTITVNLGNVEVSQTAPVTFTIFALPWELTHLTMQFNIAGGITKKLELKQRASETDPYEFVTFAAGKKYRITNLNVPGDGWTYTLEEVVPNAPMERNVPTGGTATKGMYSYRTKGSDKEPVTMKFRYSPADEDGNNLEHWSTDLPAWLTSLVVGAHTGEQNPDDPFTLTGTYTVLDAMEVDIVNEIKEHIEILKGNGNNGASSSFPQDLALYDIDNLTSARSAGAKTANSYVVDRAGWYMFPLVYGNAIDWEKASSNGRNVGAYYDGQSDGWGDSYAVLHRFRNYLNNGITSPYILDDTGLGVDQVEAVIVWEDITSDKLFINAPSIVATPLTTALYVDQNGTPKTVPYIKFNVDADNIRQGNAVIALREKEGDRRIIWSWHIWVTDTDLSTVTVYTRSSVNPVVPSNQMLKVNLGWCDAKVVTGRVYTPRKYFVEVKQETGNADPVVFAVTQTADPSVSTSIGSAPCYQYGRKDPFIPVKGELMSLVNKESSSPAGYTVVLGSTSIPYVSAGGNSDGNVSYGIQNPHTMYGRGELNGWVASLQRNLWDMTETATNAHSYQSGAPNAGRDKKVVKTVYDPCPPGFSVPNYTAFTIFTKTGGNVSTSNYSGWNTENPETEDGLGFLLNTSDEGGQTILFPYQGFRSEGIVYSGPFYLLNSKSAGDRYSVMFNIGGPMRDVTKSNAYQVRPIKEMR